jgi:exosortase
LVYITISFLLLIAIYSPVWYYLYDSWARDPYYSHGPLVLLLFILLLFLKRKQISAAITRSNRDGNSLVLLSGLLLYTLGMFLDFRFIEEISFIVSLAGLVILVFGKDVFRIIAFPIFFLLFMVPLPAALPLILALPLQLYAATASNIILQFIGVPIYQDGVNLYIPNFNFIVERSCNGLNSSISLLMVSILFVHLLPCRKSKKILLVLLSVPIALSANIIRITMIVIIAFILNPEEAMFFFHELSSPLLFIIELCILFSLGRLFQCYGTKTA